MNTSQRWEIKIVYIGGGSRGWAPKLISDLALSADLEGNIVLYDIDRGAAEANLEVAEGIFAHPNAKSSFAVSVSESLDDALSGADFVVLSIEPGPTTLRYADLEIPRRYGIVQTVGDTTGPGGLLRALRSVPIFEQFARRIMERCPDAWVINYTNPLSICTASLYSAEPKIKAFGCCHEVFSTQERLATLAAEWYGVPVPVRRQIKLDIAGINHFTFATAAEWEGHDLLARVREMISAPGFFSDHSGQARERRAAELWFDNDGLVAYDFLRRFGVLGAAGDRHLVEFVPWYLSSEEEVDQIHALLGAGDLTTNVNLPNRGQLAPLPAGSIVETNVRISKDNMEPVDARPLPALLADHIRSACTRQHSILEAARRGDRELAFQTLLLDPLVRLSTDRAFEMFSEMTEYIRDYLPGW